MEKHGIKIADDTFWMYKNLNGEYVLPDFTPRKLKWYQKLFKLLNIKH